MISFSWFLGGGVDVSAIIFILNTEEAVETFETRQFQFSAIASAQAIGASSSTEVDIKYQLMSGPFQLGCFLMQKSIAHIFGNEEMRMKNIMEEK